MTATQREHVRFDIGAIVDALGDSWSIYNDTTIAGPDNMKVSITYTAHPIPGISLTGLDHFGKPVGSLAHNGHQLTTTYTAPPDRTPTDIAQTLRLFVFPDYSIALKQLGTRKQIVARQQLESQQLLAELLNTTGAAPINDDKNQWTWQFGPNTYDFATLGANVTMNSISLMFPHLPHDLALHLVTVVQTYYVQDEQCAAPA